MSARDGGPAFPCTRAEQLIGGWEDVTYPGMSLRDWFAGQAIVGMMAALAGAGVQQWPDDDLAQQAYRLSDAMLAARESQP